MHCYLNCSDIESQSCFTSVIASGLLETFGLREVFNPIGCAMSVADLGFRNRRYLGGSNTYIDTQSYKVSHGNQSIRLSFGFADDFFHLIAIFILMLYNYTYCGSNIAGGGAPQFST